MCSSYHFRTKLPMMERTKQGCQACNEEAVINACTGICTTRSWNDEVKWSQSHQKRLNAQFSQGQIQQLVSASLDGCNLFKVLHPSTVSVDGSQSRNLAASKPGQRSDLGVGFEGSPFRVPVFVDTSLSSFAFRSSPRIFRRRHARSSTCNSRKRARCLHTCG